MIILWERPHNREKEAFSSFCHSYVFQVNTNILIMRDNITPTSGSELLLGFILTLTLPVKKI